MVQMESLKSDEDQVPETTVSENLPAPSEIGDSSVSCQPAQLSKSKQKKLMKKQMWLESKAEKRTLQKIKRKQKRREKIERGDDMGPSKKKLKQNTMKNSSCRIQVVVDCSFDDLMMEKDINKLGQQIQYCYSSNRRAKKPLQLHLTSLSGKTRDRLERIGDYRGWDINIDSRSYLEKFDKSSLVYLTSDSANVLETLAPDKVYVIGGLVDHNHHKSHCFNLAVANGIEHAQLPIGGYIQLSSRNVLTVNHVFEILLRYTETQSWKDAFFQVIPKRKQANGDSTASDNSTCDNNSIAPNNDASISKGDITSKSHRFSVELLGDSDATDGACNSIVNRDTNGVVVKSVAEDET